MEQAVNWASKIDWSATGDVWAGVGGLAAGAAAVFLAFYAKQGLTVWKEQQLGIKSLDLAQELLAEIFTVEETLRFVISPFVSSSELSAVERVTGESDRDYELRQRYDAVILRYEQHADQFSKVRALAFRARATLGEDVFAAVKELLLLRNEIQRAAQRAYIAARTVDEVERRMAIGMTVLDGKREAAYTELWEAQKRFWSMEGDETLEKSMEAAVSICVERLRAVMQAVLRG